MEDLDLLDVTGEEVQKENQETEIQNTENGETTEEVVGYEETSSFYTPTILIDNVTYSYYDLAYKEQIRTNALILTILIAFVSIFALTRFYRWFRSIFTVKF